MDSVELRSRRDFYTMIIVLETKMVITLCSKRWSKTWREGVKGWIEEFMVSTEQPIFPWWRNFGSNHHMYLKFMNSFMVYTNCVHLSQNLIFAEHDLSDALRVTLLCLCRSVCES